MYSGTTYLNLQGYATNYRFIKTNPITPKGTRNKPTKTLKRNIFISSNIVCIFSNSSINLFTNRFSHPCFKRVHFVLSNKQTQPTNHQHYSTICEYHHFYEYDRHYSHTSISPFLMRALICRALCGLSPLGSHSM